MSMVAKIKLTVNGTQYKPGDTISEKINAGTEAVWLRDGYIEKKTSTKSTKAKEETTATETTTEETA